MTEAALVSLVALVGWLILIWRSGALQSLGNNRKVTWAASWLAIFVAVMLIFQTVS